MASCPACEAKLTDAQYQIGVCPHCGVPLPPAEMPPSDKAGADSGRPGPEEKTTRNVETVFIDQGDPVSSEAETTEPAADASSPSPPSDSQLAGPTPTIDLADSNPSVDDLEERTARNLEVTVDSAEASGGASEMVQPDSDRFTAMWQQSLASSPPANPQQTIKTDATIREGTSSLVVKSRALRPSSDASAPTADYELLDILGEGGMGVVYAARQASVDRTVAVKMLKPQASTAADQRAKFISEAVVTGDLDHPNIVPIYDLGTNEEGALFYSMKRVRGTPWNETIGGLSLSENLEILLKTCDAVAFAHAAGVVHRDLKPENVMLGDFGEVLVMDWGLALATAEFRNVGSITQSGSMGGTPAYMAPEMATGPVEKVGPASDIYLLGGILYEIITGKLPHTGKDVMECLMNSAKNVIQPTEKSGELLDVAYQAMSTRTEDRYGSVKEYQAAIRDYQSHSESIVLAARAQQELDRAQETEAYRDFAQALYGFQEAVALWESNATAIAGVSRARLAYAESALRKGDFDLGLSLLDDDDPAHEELRGELETARRKRESRQFLFKTMAVATGVLAAAVFIVVAAAAYLINVDRHRALAAEKQALEAEQIADSERQVAVVAREEAVTQRQVAEAQRERADQQRQRAETEKERADEERSRADVERDRAVAARDVAEKAKAAEEYEAYIARIGLASAKIDENAFDNAVAILKECKPELRHWEWGRLWHLCQQHVESFEAEAPVVSVAFDPSGRRFATGSWDGKLRLWDTASGKVLGDYPHGQYVHSAAFSPDGRLVASASSDRSVHIRSADDGTLLHELRGHDDAVLCVAFSPQGDRLLSGSYDRSARLWDVETGQLLHTFLGHNWWVWAAVFSPDGRRIVTAGQDSKAIVWSGDPANEYRRLTEFVGHSGPVYAAAFAPDGKRVATCSYDKTIMIWDPDQVEPIDLRKRLDGLPDPDLHYRLLEGHRGPVRSVNFSTDGKLLVSGSRDNTVRLWDADTGRLVKILRGHGGWVRACAFSPDARQVLSGSFDNHAKLWDIAGYEEIRVLSGRVLAGHADAVLDARFSPDGNRIVTASRDRTARTWAFDSGLPIGEFKEGHEFLATSAVFSPDGRKLFTGAGDNTVRIWDVSSGGQSRTLESTGRSGALALSPDARWIVTGSDSDSTKVWDAASGELVQELAIAPGNQDGGDITAVAVSPGSRQILAGDTHGHCRLWAYDESQNKWTPRHELTGHGATITAVSFLPSGDRVLTASGDRTVGQWNTETGEEIRDLALRHDDWVHSLALSSDGRHALTGCENGDLQLWDVERAQVVRRFETGDTPINAVDISLDGRYILAASSQGMTVRVWDVQTGNELSTVVENRGGPFLDFNVVGGLVWSARFSPHAASVLTVGGNSARLWRLDTGEETMSFSPHGAVATARYAPDGRRIVTASWDNSAKIWNAESGKSELKLTGRHTGYVNSAVFSPNGNMVLTASDDRTAQLWNARSGDVLPVTYSGHGGRVREAVFSVDGARVLTASNDKTARIWETRSGRLLTTLTGHEWAVLSAAFSHDGRLVITGSEDNTARIWDAADGNALLTLTGHTGGIASVAFSPDARRALTASQDGSAKLWDAATGKEILTLNGHEQEVTSVSFSPDGKHVLTGSRDGSAILWLASPWQQGPTHNTP